MAVNMSETEHILERELWREVRDELKRRCVSLRIRYVARNNEYEVRVMPDEPGHPGWFVFWLSRFIADDMMPPMSAIAVRTSDELRDELQAQERRASTMRFVADRLCEWLLRRDKP